MPAATSDSHPTLFVALCCLAHTELAWLFQEPHTGLEDCLMVTYEIMPHK